MTTLPKGQHNETPTLSIITVSYNCHDYLQKMIASVEKYMQSIPYELIIVENHSSDKTIDMLQRTCDQSNNLLCIPLESTVGFSAANNIGAKRASGRFLLFLNPDTELIDDSVKFLPRLLEQTNDLGAVSPVLLNADRTYQIQGGSLPSLLNVFFWMFFIDDLPAFSTIVQPYQKKHPPHQSVSYQGWIGGTSLMMSHADFLAINGWNEKYPLYAEDIDLCYRLLQMSKRCAITNSSSLIHYQNKSGNPEKAILGEYRGLCLYWSLHKPAWQLPFLKVFLWIGAWLRVVIFGILCGDVQKRTIYLKAQKLLFLD